MFSHSSIAPAGAHHHHQPNRKPSVHGIRISKKLPIQDTPRAQRKHFFAWREHPQTTRSQSTHVTHVIRNSPDVFACMVSRMSIDSNASQIPAAPKPRADWEWSVHNYACVGKWGAFFFTEKLPKCGIMMQNQRARRPMCFGLFR